MGIERTVTDGVALLAMDDGRVNAMDLGFFAELNAALDDCAGDAAVVLAGRPGMFSAGLNTKVMAGLDLDGMAELVSVFGESERRRDASAMPRPSRVTSSTACWRNSLV